MNRQKFLQSNIDAEKEEQLADVEKMKKEKLENLKK